MDTSSNLLSRLQLLVLSLVGALALVGCGDSDADIDSPEAEGGSAAVAHAHDTPGETCFICDATQRDASRLWCTEHSRYEDRCWICQPQLEDKSRPYCSEHWLYEDECSLCRPDTVEPVDTEQEKKSGAAPPAPTQELQCREHRLAEAQCGICQPQLAAQLEPGEELKVRFESPRSAAKAGIRTVPALPMASSPGVGVVCEVSYDENAFARITPLAPGLVRTVHVDVGADVAAGEVLVEVHSAEVAAAKAAFVSAGVALELKDVACARERGLAEKKISSERELQEAEAARRLAQLELSTTRQRLLNYGFTEAEVESIRADEDTSASILVRAPFGGTLVDREAVVGEAVAPGDTLFTVANLDTMWLSLAIPADLSHLIHPGMPVEAAFANRPDAEARGAITWVSTMIDERTRMLRARAVVDNEARALWAGMFGDARIVLSPREEAVGVPRGSLQLYENNPYVFVRLEADLYSLRRVAILDQPSEELVAVVEGLRPHDPVVAEGAFTVMSEFLKSRLGAGCVDD